MAMLQKASTCASVFHADLPRQLFPITSADYGMYQSFFAQAPGTAVYANSWTYITQACRGIGEGLGLRYTHGDALYSVGRHHGHFVVVNPLGNLFELSEVVRQLRRASARPVFIKKIHSPQAAFLGDLVPEPASYFIGGQPAPGPYVWDATAYADDDTYPEQIINVDLVLRFAVKPHEWFNQYGTLSSGSGSVDANSVRHSYRQFRRCVRNASHFANEVKVVDFHSSLLSDAQRFVHDYFGDARTSAVNAYVNVLASLERQLPDGSQFCYIVKVGAASAVTGLIFAERLGPCSAGIYMRLIRRQMPGLPEYAMAQVLDRLRQAGIDTVNLGGSETLGLHVFKQKLAPIEERHFPVFVYGAPHKAPHADSR